MYDIRKHKELGPQTRPVWPLYGGPASGVWVPANNFLLGGGDKVNNNNNPYKNCEESISYTRCNKRNKHDYFICTIFYV